MQRTYPGMSQDVNLRLGPEELGAVTMTSSALMETGPSTIKATGVPQFVPDSQEELLVLPPMPKSLFEELTTFHGDLDSSVTEPKSSEDEARARGYIPSK